MKCNFCNFEDNGDYPEDHQTIIDDDFTYRKSFDYRASDKPEYMRFQMAHVKAFNVSVYVNGYKGALGVMVDDQGEELMCVEKKINFCPMCGRKIKEVKT